MEEYISRDELHWKEKEEKWGDSKLCRNWPACTVEWNCDMFECKLYDSFVQKRGEQTEDFNFNHLDY